MYIRLSCISTELLRGSRVCRLVDKWASEHLYHTHNSSLLSVEVVSRVTSTTSPYAVSLPQCITILFNSTYILNLFNFKEHRLNVPLWKKALQNKVKYWNMVQLMSVVDLFIKQTHNNNCDATCNVAYNNCFRSSLSKSWAIHSLTTNLKGYNSKK